MLKLLKRLRPREWIMIAIIVGLTVVQVFFTMGMVDRMADLMQSITYISYQHQPDQLPDALKAAYAAAGSWEALEAQARAGYEAGLVGEDVVNLYHSIATASTGDVWVAGGKMLLFAAAAIVVQITISVLAAFVASGFATNIRRCINEKVSTFSLAEINRFSTASLVTRSTNDIEHTQFTLLLMMRMIFAAPVTAVWAIIKVQATSLPLTTAIVIAVVVLIVMAALLLGATIPKFRVMQKRYDRINGVTREGLKGIRVVHAYNAEKYQEEKFNQANTELMKLNLFTGRVMGLSNPLITILMDGLVLAIYWIGANLINEGEMTYATLSSFTMLATQIIMAFMMLLMMFVMLPRAMVSARRVSEVLETTPSIVDPENPIEPTEVGTIEFRDVGFHYPDADENVVEHISFKAKKGDTIAIVGSTGCGKSTLINLIARLYDATEGEVLVDGVNVKNIAAEHLRKRIGFVPQRGILFSGTVRSNLCFGTGEVSQEDLENAAKLACADEFISEMENGYDAPIAQGGTNVSGGQRQRLCIARAIMAKPEIFIFDDSFSALDLKTDLQVRNNLKASQKEATKVIVAQRVGTIIEADLILVLEEGHIVGQGTHKELLQTCPVYKQIALSQLTAEELGL